MTFAPVTFRPNNIPTTRAAAPATTRAAAPATTSANLIATQGVQVIQVASQPIRPATTTAVPSSSAFRPTTTFAPFRPTTPAPKAPKAPFIKPTTPALKAPFITPTTPALKAPFITPTTPVPKAQEPTAASVQQQVQQPAASVQQPAAVIRNLHHDMYTLAFLKTLPPSPKSNELLPEMISYWGVNKINQWVKNQNSYMKSIGKHIMDMPLLPTQPSSSMSFQSPSFANPGV
jgi:hypothetical protein